MEYVRGGKGKPYRKTLGAGATDNVRFESKTLMIEVTNEGTNELRVYLTEAAFSADAGDHIRVGPRIAGQHDLTRVIRAELDRVWFRSAGGTTFEMVSYGIN